jgi:4'-phosphopantetheinyl transferase
LNIRPDQIGFRYQELGKPELADYSHLQFNLSHSGSIALYAITLEHPIGVDIERLRACDELALAQRFFEPSEFQALLELKPEYRQNAFFEIWSKKEAFIKALGQGLAYLDQFSVIKNSTLKEWHLESFDYQHDYKAAFATKQPVKQIHYWQI